MRTSTGIVLAHGGAVDPLLRLAGVPLAVRAVLTLQKAGFRRVVLVARDEILRAVQDDARVHVALEGAAGYDEALAIAGGPAVLARHDLVADPVVYAALASAADGIPLIAVRDGKPLGPTLVVPGVDFNKLNSARTLATAGWSEAVDTAEGRRRAVRALFEACRKPVDGIVSRNLNRHVSIAISKRLVATSVLPNHITALTLLLGLAAAVFVARGGYAWPLAGAALMQINSIVDGVDGELARVRFEQSRLGDWLDNVSDDVTALAFWVGLTIGAADLDPRLAVAGWIAVASHFLFVALTYGELLRRNSGTYFDIQWYDPSRATWPTRLMRLLTLIPRRDFFVFFCLCAAAAGLLFYALPLIALVSFATLAAAVARNLRDLLPRAATGQDGGS
jgi:phosphatidylglycerophosphate synthase